MKPLLMDMSSSLIQKKKKPRSFCVLNYKTHRSYPTLYFHPSNVCSDCSDNRWISHSVRRTVSSFQFWISEQTLVSGIYRGLSISSHAIFHTKAKAWG